MKDYAYKGTGISFARFKEMRGFCEQYDQKKREANLIEHGMTSPSFDEPATQGGMPGNPTENKALKAAPLRADILLIERCVKEATQHRPELYEALLLSVTRRHGERKAGELGLLYERAKKYRKRFFITLDRELRKRGR